LEDVIMSLDMSLRPDLFRQQMPMLKEQPSASDSSTIQSGAAQPSTSPSKQALPQKETTKVVTLTHSKRNDVPLTVDNEAGPSLSHPLTLSLSHLNFITRFTIIPTQ
jgi:hypothetical protein